MLEDFGVDPETCLNKNGDNIIRVAAYHGHIPILDYARDELNLHVMGRNRSVTLVPFGGRGRGCRCV